MHSFPIPSDQRKNRSCISRYEFWCNPLFHESQDSLSLIPKSVDSGVGSVLDAIPLQTQSLRTDGFLHLPGKPTLEKQNVFIPFNQRFSAIRML